ncbi:MAG: nucleotidyltransferase domain-containing protein [Chloroflexota bacterium]|mgnify:FL=1
MNGLTTQQQAALAQVLSHYPVVAAYLYGSVAAGIATPLSDVDIALVIVENSVPKDQRLHFELNAEIEISDKCSLPNADVRTINDAPIMVRGEVVTNGILLYTGNDEARVEFETRTMSEYFDYYPIYEFFRRAYFADIRKRGLVRA